MLGTCHYTSHSFEVLEQIFHVFAESVDHPGLDDHAATVWKEISDVVFFVLLTPPKERIRRVLELDFLFQSREDFLPGRLSLFSLLARRRFGLFFAVFLE